jgi:hypothetical protein
MIVRRILAMLAVGLCVAVPRPTLAQNAAPVDPPPSTGPPSAPATTVDVDDLPISVSRIGRQLSRPAPISEEITRPMFRIDIVERRAKWFSEIEWLPETDRRLPMPPGPAWHREFMDMVTPQTARPFGQVTGWDLLQLSATSLVEGMTTKSLAQKIKAASARRQAEEAHAEVDAAIEAWKGERDGGSQEPDADGAPQDALPSTGGAANPTPPPPD